MNEARYHFDSFFRHLHHFVYGTFFFFLNQKHSKPKRERGTEEAAVLTRGFPVERAVGRTPGPSTLRE